MSELCKSLGIAQELHIATDYRNAIIEYWDKVGLFALCSVTFNSLHQVIYRGVDVSPALQK